MSGGFNIQCSPTPTLWISSVAGTPGVPQAPLLNEDGAQLLNEDGSPLLAE